MIDVAYQYLVRTKKQKLALGREPAQVLTETVATTLCREHFTLGTGCFRNPVLLGSGDDAWLLNPSSNRTGDLEIKS